MFAAMNNTMSVEQLNNSVYVSFQKSNKKKLHPAETETYCKQIPMKRKNFSTDEIALLKRLIQKYRPYQIDNKKTDSVNLGEKQRLWETITAEFNSQYSHGDVTSVKQLRKLWDNLKTRRKNELLRERLMNEENNDSKTSLFDLGIKEDLNESMDSVNMNFDYPVGSNEEPYINRTSSNSWSLPIETVIEEDDYREMRSDDNNHLAKIEAFSKTDRINCNATDDQCLCTSSKEDLDLKEKKLKLILREEESLYKLKKDEQSLKNEIALIQLRILKDKEVYLAKKRRLQIQILEKQLRSKNKAEMNGS